MAAATTRSNRDWILAEFSKGIDAERRLQEDAEATSASPPDPELTVLYHEIARADARHRGVLETIATRYGYQPGGTEASGITGALGKLTQRVGEMGATPMARIAHDLNGKANAIHWSAAWVEAFQAIGDLESARELAGILSEERSHHTALQAGLNRLVLRGATAAGSEA